MTKQNNITSKFRFVLSLMIIVGVSIVGILIYITNSHDGNQTIAISALEKQQVLLKKISSRAALLEKKAVGQVAAMTALDTPRQMPDHQFTAPDGSVKKIEQFRGKILLVNLWATWCAPCREEMPALSTLQAKLSGHHFSVITINIDRGGRNKPQKFLSEIGVDNLALYQDSSMEIFNTLKKEGIAFGLPLTMLLDENGYILAFMNGPAHWSSPDALTYIETAIQQKIKG